MQHLPSAAYIGKDRIQCFYPGQPKRCHRCGSSQHLSSGCSEVKCAWCQELGHRSEACRKRRCNLCGRDGHVFAQCPDADHNRVTDAELVEAAEEVERGKENEEMEVETVVSQVAPVSVVKGGRKTGDASSSVVPLSNKFEILSSNIIKEDVIEEIIEQGDGSFKLVVKGKNVRRDAVGKKKGGKVGLKKKSIEKEQGVGREAYGLRGFKKMGGVGRKPQGAVPGRKMEVQVESLVEAVDEVGGQEVHQVGVGEDGIIGEEVLVGSPADPGGGAKPPDPGPPLEPIVIVNSLSNDVVSPDSQSDDDDLPLAVIVKKRGSLEEGSSLRV